MDDLLIIVADLPIVEKTLQTAGYVLDQSGMNESISFYGNMIHIYESKDDFNIDRKCIDTIILYENPLSPVPKKYFFYSK